MTLKDYREELPDDSPNINIFSPRNSEHPYFAEIRGLKVSTHLLICRDGELVQFVPFNRRAWHAGESSFHGHSDCNDFSIGIELEGDDALPYADEQYDTLIAASDALLAAYPG